jgi:Tol biopolymer transport system component
LQWRGRTLEWWPSEPLLPDTEYHLTLPAGLRSRQGRALLKPAEWRFRTGRPRILYLSWNEQGYNQILTVSVGGQDATPLTEAEWGVLDYGVAPGGEIVAYSAYREDRGTDLWVHEIAAAGNRLLLACPAAACSNPAWAADGRRLIYERRNLDQPGLPPGPPRLWWLDVASGETVPVFEDSQWLGSTARFSPDGRQISYIAPLSQAVEIYDLQSGEGQRFTSRSGEPAAWSPDSRSLIVTDVDLTGEQYAMRLYRHDLDGLGTHNISGTGPTDDNWPAYAPGGAWLAFNRKPASVPSGRQIWLMRPDGGDAQPLTDDPEAQYGPPIWSPDARSLLYQRYMPAEPSAEPGIWVLELATGESLQIAAAGTQPAWLP